jgi:hypothetical protein
MGEVFLLPHSLIKIAKHQPRFVRAVFNLPKLRPHKVAVTRLRLSIDKCAAPHVIIGASAHMHINMVVTERQQIHRHVLRPIQSQTTSFAITFNLKTILHTNSEPKVFNTLFTLPSLTNED